ncbi:MAG: TRAP transporter small permease [Rhizobiaceae bacterium]|nr:TRAP transporter small permease [Rhizobiaceae bacterium]
MIARINKFVGVTLSYGYAIVAVLTFAEVCARYIFNSPTQWSVEIVILIAALHYIMGGAQAAADETHIRITAIYDRLPASAQYVLTLFERVLVIVVCAIVGLWAFYQAQFAIQIGERSGSNWNTPSPMILKVVVVIGIVMIGLQAVEYLIRDLRKHNEP